MIEIRLTARGSAVERVNKQKAASMRSETIAKFSAFFCISICIAECRSIWALIGKCIWKYVWIAQEFRHDEVVSWKS